MKTSVIINDRNISIEINHYAIRIFNDDNELTRLLKHNAKPVTNELIQQIKTCYFRIFNERFKVSDNSIAVEIWAHVYVEKFTKAIQSYFSLQFFNKILNKIIFHCKVIDIGEKGHDDNRFVWDILAPFKRLISAFLFF